MKEGLVNRAIKKAGEWWFSKLVCWRELSRWAGRMSLRQRGRTAHHVTHKKQAAKLPELTKQSGDGCEELLNILITGGWGDQVLQTSLPWPRLMACCRHRREGRRARRTGRKENVWNLPGSHVAVTRVHSVHHVQNPYDNTALMIVQLNKEQLVQEFVSLAGRESMGKKFQLQSLKRELMKTN